MSNQEKVFADGIYFKRHDNAPDFVVGSLSLNIEKARGFIQSNNKDGWVNMQIKKSQGGKYYVELDTWEPQQTAEPAQSSAPDNFEDDIPF